MLKVDGWLEFADIPELERVWDENPDAPTLDLNDLRDADADALAFLRRLRAGGARLVRYSAYMALRLGLPADNDGHRLHSLHTPP